MFSNSNLVKSLISAAISVSTASAMEEPSAGNSTSQLNQNMNEAQNQERSSGMPIDKLNSEFSEQAKKYLGEMYLGYSLKSIAKDITWLSKDKDSTFNRVI